MTTSTKQRTARDTARIGACLAVAALCAELLLVPPVRAADEDSAIPRRADGRPDLSGTYDVATLTPLERPAELGEKLTLSEEEAAAIVEHWRGNFAADHAPSDPDRGAPPKGGVGIYAPEFTAAAGEVGGYNAFFVDIGDSVFRIDGEYRSSIITDPPDGRRPPLSELGRKQREEAARLRHRNTGTAWWLDLEVGPYDDPELRPLGERCLLSRSRSGPPVLPAMYNNLKRIVQTDDTVVILAEQMHDARIVRLDSEHPPEDIRRWMGDSVGRWEGDTLVVDTTSFLEQDDVVRGLRVVERFTPRPDGSLLYRFTVYDPGYTRPWSGEYPWPRTEERLFEYACHEGNYSFGNILRGARLLERDALGKAVRE